MYHKTEFYSSFKMAKKSGQKFLYISQKATTFAIENSKTCPSLKCSMLLKVTDLIKFRSF